MSSCAAKAWALGGSFGPANGIFPVNDASPGRAEAERSFNRFTFANHARLRSGFTWLDDSALCGARFGVDGLACYEPGHPPKRLRNTHADPKLQHPCTF